MGERTKRGGKSGQVGQRERGKWREGRTDRERKEDEEIWEGKLERGEGVG